MRENAIKDRIQLALSCILGVRTFCNVIGKAWFGKFLSRGGDGHVTLANARPNDVGLHDGSADLIGYYTFTITAEMVGKEIAAFVSIEVKKPGENLKPNQVLWLNRMIAAHCIAGVARSAEEAVQIVRDFMTKLGGK